MSRPALTLICDTGAHCTACRAADATFRDSLADVYAVPADWPVCPHGRPMGYVGTATPEQVIGVGDIVARLTKAVGIQPCGGCNKRRAWLNQAIPLGT